MEDWTTKQLADAPVGLKGGWFTSYLEFYEVQRSLLEGTTMAVLVAVIVSLVVLLLTTLNLVVSIVAVVSVAAVMMVTLAALVILGWRLNVLESIVVTAAIGLAVDLTLHYAVAYTKAPQGKRKVAVSWAITRLASPVLMTTLTSLAAAAAMLSATVLAYIHIATFLIIIALTSFIYSTFFFLPLMSIIGPEEQCSPFVTAADCSEFCSCRDDEHLDKSVYQQACVSESTLSTSSVCPSGPFTSGLGSHDLDVQFMPCNPQELEPLTAASSTGGAIGSVTTQRCSSNAIRGEYNLKDPQLPSIHGPCGSSKCTYHHHHHHQHAKGLMVSIQQSRQSKQQQQNGSCTQLVIRKESTESQVRQSKY